MYIFINGLTCLGFCPVRPWPRQTRKNRILHQAYRNIGCVDVRGASGHIYSVAFLAEREEMHHQK